MRLISALVQGGGHLLVHVQGRRPLPHAAIAAQPLKGLKARTFNAAYGLVANLKTIKVRDWRTAPSVWG